MSECKVNGKLVKDDKEIDGYYHYGILKMTNQEYVDTYGKNLEDALKKYHDEHNEYPSDYTTLELPSSDKEVSCDVSINYDGKVYLNNCKVDNEDVVDDNNEVYVYGKYVPSYIIGDEITYNGIKFYAIENSDTMKDYVTMLKEEPLTVDEVNLYGGVGTEENRVNKYTDTSIGFARDIQGYGGVAYHSTETCGNVNGEIRRDCVFDYNESDINYILNNWKDEKLKRNDITTDDYYNVRLLTLIEYNELKSASLYNSWLYNSKYWYWLMDAYSSYDMYAVTPSNQINGIHGGYYSLPTVRPVVTLKKSALE